MAKSTAKIGSIYNIGIGFDNSADAVVIGIEKDSTNGDTALLELIDFGSPLQKIYVSALEAVPQIERDINLSDFNFSRGEYDCTDSLKNFIYRSEQMAIEDENKR